MRIQSLRKVCQVSRLNIPLVNEKISDHVFGEKTKKKVGKCENLKQIKESLRNMKIFNEKCSDFDSGTGLINFDKEFDSYFLLC